MKPMGRRVLRLSVRILAVLLISVPTMATLRPVAAAAVTPEAALIRVLTAPKIQAGWFAPAFLAQVSVAKLQEARASIVAELGAFRSVTAEGQGVFLVQFTQGIATAQVQLDGKGRIDGLQFTDLHHGAASPGGAKPTLKVALARLFSSTVPFQTWFAPTFLAKVPPAQVQQILAGLAESLGPYGSVLVKPDGTFTAHYRYGVVDGTAHIDQQGRFDGLLFSKVAYTPLSRSAALGGLRNLPGLTSVLVLANGAPVLAVDPDRSLAVGSAFKLAVLAAVQQEVATHRLSWTQKVTLLAQDKSLPSGELQTHPVGSSYTLADVAKEMISISDNTAANMLIRVAGRAAIDALIPVSDQPVLTTRELFILKDPANAALRTRYLAALTPQARMKILPAIDRLPLPSAAIFAGGKPLALEIEWRFSVRQLCGLMGKVAALPQMSVNPGVATAADWKHVAYKGGSEPGVLNLTTQVTALNGVTYCIAATWNNSRQVLNEAQFEMLYANILTSYRTAG